MSSGAQPGLVMPNGRMEIPVSSRYGLDGSFLMDAGASSLYLLERNRRCGQSSTSSQR